ncbi:hypothetical protein METHB2_50034 [Candidatus Methylobacter favarea]|uniref:Uncharacterized protein n=1 Tax=Candidatus Methylobacter favarea TaxID=2707345 RepID=A0A8S0WBK8_9GAMM|nr:hypothetical protein METHB2_50034 [Candidatus Methylobacter favarea]
MTGMSSKNQSWVIGGGNSSWQHVYRRTDNTDIKLFCRKANAALIL